jgi:predicted translin family RNA/ssDNA-binding protein
MQSASSLLEQASALFKQCEKTFVRLRELSSEGAYRAALEEYAEARLFECYLAAGKLGKLEPRAMDPSVYLAGLCDTTGEMVRYAVRQVTLGNPQAVHDVHETVATVIEFLLDLDLTGYLRTKFDQAKKNLGRLEEMTYDLAIRGSRGVGI